MSYLRASCNSEDIIDSYTWFAFLHSLYTANITMVRAILKINLLNIKLEDTYYEIYDYDILDVIHASFWVV